MRYMPTLTPRILCGFEVDLAKNGRRGVGFVIIDGPARSSILILGTYKRLNGGMHMFEKGRTYHRRTDIHSRFGGQEQGGISTPREYPYIFLFSGDSGEQYGYKDGWADDNTFRYSGEGQRGDMQMLRGNLAIKNHVEKNKTIHLFERVRNSYYRYAGELEYVRHSVEERVIDADGRTRKAIVFTLSRV